MDGNTWFNGSLESFLLVFRGLHIFFPGFFLGILGFGVRVLSFRRGWFGPRLNFIDSRFFGGGFLFAFVRVGFISSDDNVTSHTSRDEPKIPRAQESGFHDTLGFSYLFAVFFWPWFLLQEGIFSWRLSGFILFFFN